ncbi:hypothetical protein [Pseudomonas synxantha]|jgi:phytoene dehydrogenase-like protein|uniref:Phytoene dehydrogenase-like protein n=1 Tax=Pseudomonas synxantha TaxID=47883 RepID=A0ACC6JKG9_9PSED|nr:hypothetical protein [Pseudomonas synxantha]MDR6607011.1 phytoene dehydrogenase-like protein [Pseudomonas synxantha]
MNRSVLLGLFVAASMMASTSFAAEKDQCAVNLQTIENAKAQIPPEMAEQVADSVEKAQTDHAKGTKKGIDDCVAETNQTIQDLKNASKGGK